MKNNEYNKVRVTNENVKNTPEFVGVPKTDSAAYIEATSGYKDELNSRRTNNDKIEEIGVHKQKKTAFTRQDYKKVQHGPTHLASTAGHTVVAATTVSVTAIAVVVVGTTIIDEYVEELDPIVYLESDISTDSISFRFTMPSKLLNYEQEVDPGTTEPEYYDTTNVKAMVYNEGYMDDQYVMEIGEYNEDPYNYLEGWMGFYGLTPNTNYTLCIYLEHVRSYPQGKDDEVLGLDNLSYRNFSTKPIPSNLITFTSLSADSNSVSFEFRVHPTTVGVDVGETQIDPNHVALFAEINDSTNEYYDSLMIQSIVKERESDYLLCYGSFSNLRFSTTYTIKISQSREQEYALLGQTTFTTSGSIGQFMTPQATSTTLNIQLVMPNDYAYGSDETPGSTPEISRIYVLAKDIGGMQQQSYVTDYYIYDDNHVIGTASFDNLYPSTTYTLEAYSIDYQDMVLASTTARTADTSGVFNGVTISESVSFYAHQFDVTLDYVDDGTVYSNFVLTFKDNTWTTLGSFELQATTDGQHLEVEKDTSQPTEAYTFGLHQVSYYSLSVYNNELQQTEILVDDTEFTFTDTDRTQFIGQGLYSPFKVQMSMVVGNQCIMPIRLDFVDDAHNWGESFSISIENENATLTAQLERTTEWQYAELTGQSFASHLGEEFTVEILDQFGNPQLNSTNQVVELADENEIFDIKLLDLDSNNSITFSNNDRQFDYQAYYLYPNSITADDLTIVFQDANDSSYEFVFTLGADSYPSATTLSRVLDQPYYMPSGVQIDTYQNIVSAYGNRTYKVYARYLPQSGTTQQEKLLYEDVTFIFE